MSVVFSFFPARISVPLLTRESFLSYWHRYTSPTLSFDLLDPDLSPTTFYDLGLAPGPTSLDLPLLRLYRRGKVVQQVPLSEHEARRVVKRRKREERRRERKRDGIEEGESESGEGESEDEGVESDAESDDEREVEQERAMSRYRWDTSAVRLPLPPYLTPGSRKGTDSACLDCRPRSSASSSYASDQDFCNRHRARHCNTLGCSNACRESRQLNEEPLTTMVCPPAKSKGQQQHPVIKLQARIRHHHQRVATFPRPAQHRSNTRYSASRLVASTTSLSSSFAGATRYCFAAGKRTCSIVRRNACSVGSDDAGLPPAG